MSRSLGAGLGNFLGKQTADPHATLTRSQRGYKKTPQPSSQLSPLYHLHVPGRRLFPPLRGKKNQLRKAKFEQRIPVISKRPM